MRPALLARQTIKNLMSAGIGSVVPRAFDSPALQHRYTLDELGFPVPL